MQEIQRMFAMDVIEPTQTKWTSLNVFVAKKDGMLRFCVVYQNLKRVKIRYLYPIPHMNKCIHPLSDNTIFSTSDQNSGYCKVGVAKEDHYKTAFTFQHGLTALHECNLDLKTHQVSFKARWKSH